MSFSLTFYLTNLWLIAGCLLAVLLAVGALLVTVVVGVIIDISRPHRGFIRVGDQSLVRLQRSFAAPGGP